MGSRETRGGAGDGSAEASSSAVSLSIIHLSISQLPPNATAIGNWKVRVYRDCSIRSEALDVVQRLFAVDTIPPLYLGLGISADILPAAPLFLSPTRGPYEHLRPLSR